MCPTYVDRPNGAPYATISHLAAAIDTDVLDEHDRRQRAPGEQRRSQSGEVRLVMAVFEDAVTTLRKYHGLTAPNAKRLTHEVEAWVKNGEDWWPFSFVRCCELLGWEPALIRAQLLGAGGQCAAVAGDAIGGAGAVSGAGVNETEGGGQ